MKALLLKELHGVGPLTLGHLVLASATWIGFVHYRGVVIEPDPTTAFGILGAGSIFGALLGFSQFARERWQGTQAFLIHRESSVRDAFFAKITVGLVATYAMTWVPILAYFLFGQAFRGWGGMAQSSRLFELAWIAFGALGGYATGVLASQMRVGTVRGLLTAFAGGLGAMSIAWIGPFAAVYSVSTGLVVTGAAYAAIHVAWSAALLWLASRLIREPWDSELSLRGVPGLIASVAITALAALPLLVIGCEFAGAEVMFVRVRYPSITYDASTKQFHALDWLGDSSKGTPQVDELRHVVGHEPMPDFAGMPPETVVEILRGQEPIFRPMYGAWNFGSSYERMKQFESQSGSAAQVSLELIALDTVWGEQRPTQFRGGGPGWHSIARSKDQFGLVYLDRGAGVVRLLWMQCDVRSSSPRYGQDEPVSSRESIVRKPMGSGDFSASTIVVPGAGPTACLFDPSDGSLSAFDTTDADVRLVPVALPDGDRPQRVAFLYEPRCAVWGELRALASPRIVVGEKASYVWTEHGFTSDVAAFGGLPLEEARKAQSFLRKAEWRSAAKVDSSVEEVSSGKTLYRFSYQPVTEVEKSHALRAAALRIVCPPLASFFGVPNSVDLSIRSFGAFRGIEDPSKEPAFRVWLLPAQIAFTLLCTAIAAWSARTRGASRRDVIAWGALTLVFGLPGLIVFALVGLRRITDMNKSRAVQTEHAQEPKLVLARS